MYKMAFLDFPLWNFALNFVKDFIMLQIWVLLVHLYIIPIIQKKKKKKPWPFWHVHVVWVLYFCRKGLANTSFYTMVYKLSYCFYPLISYVLKLYSLLALLYLFFFIIYVISCNICIYKMFYFLFFIMIISTYREWDDGCKQG